MACTVFFVASAQSTLRCFFSVKLFAINPSFTVMFYKTTVSIHPQEAKKDAPEKKQLKAIIHNM